MVFSKGSAFLHSSVHIFIITFAFTFSPRVNLHIVLGIQAGRCLFCYARAKLRIEEEECQLLIGRNALLQNCCGVQVSSLSYQEFRAADQLDSPRR